MPIGSRTPPSGASIMAGAATAPGWVVMVSGKVDHGCFIVSFTVRSSTIST